MGVRTQAPVKDLREPRAGELAALVRVEDLGPPMSHHGLLDRGAAEVDINRIRQPPRQHPAARPIHHGDEVEEAAAHRDVGDFCAPDVVRSADIEPAQQIRPLLVLGMRDGRPRSLIDSLQSHLPHQVLDPLSADRMALPTQMTSHLARAVPRRLKELLVDQSLLLSGRPELSELPAGGGHLRPFYVAKSGIRWTELPTSQKPSQKP